MSSEARGPRSSAFMLLGLVALAIAAGCRSPDADAQSAGAPQPAADDLSQSTSIPDPDLSSAEPQVMAKIGEARRAVVAAPQASEAWGRLGVVLQAHEYLDAARDCYRQAATLDPEAFRWPFYAAQTLLKSDLEQALVWAERAAALDPTYPPAHVLRGGLLERLARPDEAVIAYRAAVDLDPTCAAASFSLGRLALAAGDAEAALAHLTRAAEQQGEVSEVHVWLARAHRQLGDETSAEREIELSRNTKGEIALDDPVMVEMLDESVSSGGYRSRAIRARKAGDLARAEALYLETVGVRSTDAGAFFELGSIQAQQGKVDAARESFRVALTHDPDHIDAMVDLATMQVFQPKFDAAVVEEAVTLLQAAVEARPDQGEIRFLLAVALARNGDHRAAWPVARKAEELGFAVPPEFLSALSQQLPEPD